MSIYEFSQALQHRSVQSIIQGSQNILNTSAEDLRPAALTKSKTSFTITPGDIKTVFKSLKAQQTIGEPISDEAIQESLNRAKIAFEARAENKLPVKMQKDSTGITRLTFNAISYTGGINNIIKDIFGVDPKIVSKIFQKGHVQSVATSSLGRITSTFGSHPIASFNNTILEISIVLDEIIKHLEKLDRESSNLPDVRAELLVNTTKRHNKYMVELQLEKKNLESGRVMGTITGPLRKYVNSAVDGGARSSFNALYRSLKKTGASSELMRMLASKRGSPSFLELLELRLLYILDPSNAKFKNDKTYSLKNVPAGSLKLFKPDRASISQLQNKIKQEVASLKKLKEGLKKRGTERTRDAKGRFASIVNITDLINGRLHEQIKKNMGTGFSTSLLNYRTGRFAESAKVESSIFNREGSIEIFYNYMKYPYATFAQGGRQSSPRSRDPNLVISKSIREIASQLVTNRLKVSPI